MIQTHYIQELFNFVIFGTYYIESFLLFCGLVEHSFSFFAPCRSIFASEVGVDHLIRMRSRTCYVHKFRFSDSIKRARPQFASSCRRAQPSTSYIAQWLINWLVLLTTVPQLKELKSRRKNLARRRFEPSTRSSHSRSNESKLMH